MKNILLSFLIFLVQHFPVTHKQTEKLSKEKSFFLPDSVTKAAMMQEQLQKFIN
ncbi:MAG: hypothetical protein IPN13_17335 [Bacteroidetes bacterium]|nr:hypothetical protein [Bacteroidota bacterium]